MDTTIFRTDDIIDFKYTNYKNETCYRTAQVKSFYYGSNEYHKKEQWIMVAYDLSKKEDRHFAMDNMREICFWK